MLGGDFNMIPRKDGGYYYGLTVTGGLGAGGEVHAAWGETKEIECLNINIYDAWDKFKETVEGMELRIGSMDKRAYYQKYYKVIRLTGFLLLLIFYPLFYALAADQLEGYGWSDEEHIVIGTEEKDIMVFDETESL